jgi:excisionase family DNA binding protein
MLTHMEIQAISPAQSFSRLAYSLAEGEALSGLSRSSLYRLIAAGKLKTVQRGRRRLIPAQELEWLCGFQNTPAGTPNA